MLFFKAEGRISKNMEQYKKYEKNFEGSNFSELSDTFFYENNKKAYIFLAIYRPTKFILGIAAKENVNIDSYVEAYLEKAEIIGEFDISEITVSAFRSLMTTSYRHDYITDQERMVSLFGMNKWNDMMDIFEESIVSECNDKTQLLEAAKSTLCEQPLSEEVERIFDGTKYDTFIGHPVHYIVQAASDRAFNEVCDVLVKALYANRRVLSKRYSVIELDIKKRIYKTDTIQALYQANTGGTIVIKIPYESERGGFLLSRGTSTVQEAVKAAVVAKDHCMDVLTVFAIDKDCKYTKQKVFECMENVSFVEIEEKNVFADRAKAYLENLAQEKKLTADEKLTGEIEENIAYNVKELDAMFYKWYDKKMKEELFPQYSFAKTAVKMMEKTPEGSAYDDLQKMIGLNGVKNLVDKAIKYYKAQKLFEAKGMKVNQNSMHMVFMGNPGTAKTTVARLFAQIMKDNDILSVGELVEVGRADLVGEFVGSTAPRVKEKFKAAMGSVLFIDEAYSLLDGDHNTFGVEAINTIVAEMENHREDLIVIFAGYPKEMQEFIDKNPGMKSRIAFSMNFDDYTAEELFDITKLMAQKQGMNFGAGVKEKLISAYESARTEAAFGNGRYARNIFEKALINQGARLADKGLDTITGSELRTITEEDIEIPEMPKQKNTVGFAV